MCAHVCSGGCTFDEKYANVLAAGGAAMALVNEEIGLFALPSTGRFDPPKTPAGDTALTAGVGTAYAAMVSREAGVWLRKLLADYVDVGQLTVAPVAYDVTVRQRWEEIEKYLDHAVR